MSLKPHIILLMLLLAACSKRTPVGETTSTVSISYKIYSWMGQPVNVIIYATKDDYKNEANSVFKTRIDAGDSVVWICNQVLKNCYVDWYTDDYALNNWGAVPLTLQGGPGPTISYHSYEVLGMSLIENGWLFIQDESHSGISIYDTKYIREVFINMNGSYSKWVMVDKRYTAIDQSVWNETPEYEKKREYIFMRDVSALHIATSNSGETDTVVF